MYGLGSADYTVHNTCVLCQLIVPYVSVVMYNYLKLKRKHTHTLILVWLFQMFSVFLACFCHVLGTHTHPLNIRCTHKLQVLSKCDFPLAVVSLSPAHVPKHYASISEVYYTDTPTAPPTLYITITHTHTPMYFQMFSACFCHVLGTCISCCTIVDFPLADVVSWYFLMCMLQLVSLAGVYTDTPTAPHTHTHTHMTYTCTCLVHTHIYKQYDT